MEYTGTISKMKTSLGGPVEYSLLLGNDHVAVNSLIGSPVTIEFLGEIFCTVCGNKTNKSFGQGSCYPCFANAPENSECIIRPELCRAHEGGGRDPEWEKRHHLQEHIVYLALSSAVKVGVTRSTQVPTRWIDQGASQAIIIALIPYRFLAGQIEVALKEHYTDKTNWRRMLRNEIKDGTDLAAEKARAVSLLPGELRQYAAPDESPISIEYPVLEYPEKVTSINLDKTPVLEGTLRGIKAQYLIFDGGRVINIRKYQGYKIRLIL
jgi:hypothetical protein